MSHNFQRPLVSIVVPAFNTEMTIRDCLISLLKQKYSNIEIIVVNDGSTDATEAILNKLSKEFPIKVTNIEHRGRSSARNIGISQAKGQIVAFGEADAKYSSDWLMNAIKHFDRNNVAGVVGPRYSWVTNTLVSRCIDLELRIRYHDPLFKTTAGWMYRKEVLMEVGGFDESLEIAEDKDLGARIKNRGYMIAFEPSSIMWHMEPRNLRELIKKTYAHARERLCFYLKYPWEYPFIEVFSFVTYLALILLSIVINPLLLLFLLGFIPVLISVQFLRLHSKARRAMVKYRTRHVFCITILSIIRKVIFVLGSLSALKMYLWHKLRKFR